MNEKDLLKRFDASLAYHESDLANRKRFTDATLTLCSTTIVWGLPIQYLGRYIFTCNLYLSTSGLLSPLVYTSEPCVDHNYFDYFEAREHIDRSNNWY